MPIAISVNFDVARFAARLDAVAAKQVPFATARALTDVAKLAQAEVTGDLPKIFDRPSPFTMRGLSIQSATKTTLASAVFVKPIQAQYLLHEEIGGTRLPSENTRKPEATALILPSKIDRNQFGNIPYGAVSRIIALADSTRELTTGQKRRKKAYDAARAKRDTGYFYLKDKGIGGRGPGGFFKRLPGHHVLRLFSFESTTRYEPRFGFRERVTLVAKTKFAECLIKRLREAIADK